MIQHLEGDCREVLPTLPAKRVQTTITSPPYFGLRSYLEANDPRKPLEMGQETTPREYIRGLVAVFREVYRVLADDGTLWLNLGDAYAKKPFPDWKIKVGDLMGLPWRVAIALQSDGWHLRSDTIWHAPNKKPESTKNRPTRAHEYLFLLSKQEKYYYDIDATREPCTSTGGASFGKQRFSAEGTGAQSRKLKSAAERNHRLGNNKRSVWKVPVRSCPGAHFAVFPPDLVKPCVLAGCPKGGTVLDPFAGAGTTGAVAEFLERNAVLIELNPVFVEMQKHREDVRKILAKKPADKKANSKPEPVEAPRSLWD